jgi:hypothetical protein
MRRYRLLILCPGTGCRRPLPTGRARPSCRRNDRADSPPAQAFECDFLACHPVVIVGHRWSPSAFVLRPTDGPARSAEGCRRAAGFSRRRGGGQLPARALPHFSETLRHSLSSLLFIQVRALCLRRTNVAPMSHRCDIVTASAVFGAPRTATPLGSRAQPYICAIRD